MRADGDALDDDRFDDDLLEVIYEIAVASLDQVISVVQVDFLT